MPLNKTKLIVVALHRDIDTYLIHTLSMSCLNVQYDLELKGGTVGSSNIPAVPSPAQGLKFASHHGHLHSSPDPATPRIKSNIFARLEIFYVTCPIIYIDRQSVIRTWHNLLLAPVPKSANGAMMETGTSDIWAVKGIFHPIHDI